MQKIQTQTTLQENVLMYKKLSLHQLAMMRQTPISNFLILLLFIFFTISRFVPATTEVPKKYHVRQSRADPIRKLTGYALVAAKAASRATLPVTANPWFRSKAIFIGSHLSCPFAVFNYIVGEPLPTVATIQLMSSSTPHFTDVNKEVYFHSIPPATIA